MIKSVAEWEPKLRQAVVKWMNELSEATDKNGGQPVIWDYKNLQDRFRQFTYSHTEILENLRNASFIKVTQAGNTRRRFHLTDGGWTYLVKENYSTLRLLLTDPIARKRNREAIAKRKPRRVVHADPTIQIIDDFRHGVEFDRKGLLKQLWRDWNTPYRMSQKATKIDGELKSHVKTPLAIIRFQNVLYPLLSFETRKFSDLARDERGEIRHEFIPLDWNYRRFATFNDKPFALVLFITSCHQIYLRRLSLEYYPALYAYGEGCGLSLVFEGDAFSVFGDKNAADFHTKLAQIKDYIIRQEADCLAAEGK